MTNSDQVNSVTTQNATVESLSNNDLKPNLELSIKQEPVSNGNANMNARFNSFGDPYEFGGSEQEREKLRAENAAKVKKHYFFLSFLFMMWFKMLSIRFTFTAKS